VAGDEFHLGSFDRHGAEPGSGSSADRAAQPRLACLEYGPFSPGLGIFAETRNCESSHRRWQSFLRCRPAPLKSQTPQTGGIVVNVGNADKQQQVEDYLTQFRAALDRVSVTDPIVRRTNQQTAS
jgi:hypothetical protein